ncbi:sensor histidine kinase [Paenibacillus sp. GCM10027626]|uniref:sensor histidine kinase n=1 Tax=Paenibacillus sp. GCM10027626 TaxID=3273411 RepID=UPI00362A28DD
MGALLGKIPLSIYPKLVVTFLLVLIPIYALSLQLNESSADNVRSEITKSMRERVHFYLYVLETDFTRTIRLQQEYANDEYLRQLSDFNSIITDIERNKALTSLLNRIRVLKASSPYIRNVHISIASIGRTLSTDQTIGSIDGELFNALSTPTDRLASPFIQQGDKLYISLPYPEIAVQGGTQYVIGVEVDKAEIKSAIGLFGESVQGGSIMIDHKKRWQIVNMTDADMQPVLAELAYKLYDNNAEDSGIRYMEWEGEKYIVIFEKSARLDSMILTYVPEEVVLGPLQKYRSGIWWLSSLSLVIIAVFSYAIYQLIHQPLRTLVRAFKQVEKGKLDGEIQYKFQDEFSYLYLQFNKMIERVRVLIHEVYEQKYRIQLSELRQLQLQINPHFLYNSFFTLYRMAKMEKLDQVMAFTKSLGHYFQFITRDGVQEVPLIEEISFVRSYVDIQNVRFGRRIHVDFPKLPECWNEQIVPRLIVQPLLENCYKHGLADEDEEGRIKVSFYEEQDRSMLMIAVEDSGTSLSEDQLFKLQHSLTINNNLKEGLGLFNVHRRVQIHYKERGGLKFSRSALGGLKAELMIPIDKDK